MKVTYDDVFNSYMELRNKIRNKKVINYFEILLESNINYLVNSINKGYKLSKFNIFFIKEKKYRLILSNNIYDKIYNHLVSKLILSKLDKYLIDSNVATRINKGTRYARYLLHKYLVKIKNKNNKFYILRFDIKKYFFNINHQVLLNKLSKYLNLEEINIIKDILDSTNKDYINNKIKLFNNKYKLNLPLYKKGKGLSIGALSSQMLATFYLNDLDHLIKEELGCKYYIRYMDDGIILMESKDKLKYIYEVLKKEIIKYDLEFNNKTKIYVSYEGFSFLGINYYIRNNRIIKRISKKLRKDIVNNRINYINYKFYKNYFRYVR